MKSAHHFHLLYRILPVTFFSLCRDDSHESMPRGFESPNYHVSLYVVLWRRLNNRQNVVSLALELLVNDILSER